MYIYSMLYIFGMYFALSYIMHVLSLNECLSSNSFSHNNFECEIIFNVCEVIFIIINVLNYHHLNI